MASSQPLPPTFRALQPSGRPMRSRSGNEALTYNTARHNVTEQVDDIHDLKRRVHMILISRLRDMGFNVDERNCPMALINFALPAFDAVLDEWENLLATPHLINDAMLTRMLRLVNSLSITTPVTNNTRVYYIRTLIYRVHELRLVINEMRNNGYENEKLIQWETELDDMQDDELVFKHYAGTKLGRRGYDRHREDLVRTSNSFVREFLQTTMQLVPDVITTVVVQELPEAQLTGFTPTAAVSDIREQALIALLRGSCINTEGGGHDPDEEPRTEDSDLFSSLGTDVVKVTTSSHNTQNLPSLPLQDCSQVVRDNLTAYVSSAQAYSNSHPHTTQTKRYPFTDALGHAVLQQVLPRVMQNGSAIALFIGSDIPPGVMNQAEPKPFFAQDVTTSNMVKNKLDFLGTWESIPGQANASDILRQLNPDTGNIFSFIDLFQWASTDRNDLEAAMRFTRAALAAGDFCIAVTFGKTTSAVGLGDFLKEASFRLKHGDDFIASLGKPSLHYYSDEVRDESQCTIVITSYHPGSVRRHAGVEYRLFLLTMMVVWLSVWELLKVAAPGKSKKDICQQAIDAVARYLVPGNRLFDELEATKLAVRDQRKNLKQAANTNAERRKNLEKTRSRKETAIALGFGSGRQTQETKRRAKNNFVLTARKDWLRVAHKDLHSKLQSTEGRVPDDIEWAQMLEDDYQRWRTWKAGYPELRMILDCGIIPTLNNVTHTVDKILQGEHRSQLLDSIKVQNEDSEVILGWLRPLARDHPGQPLYFWLPQRAPRKEIRNLLQLFLDAEADGQLTEDNIKPAWGNVLRFVQDILAANDDGAALSLYEARMETEDPRASECNSRQDTLRIRAEDTALNSEENLSGSEVFIMPNGQDASTAYFCFTVQDTDGDTWKSPPIFVPISCVGDSEADVRLIMFEGTGISVTNWSRDRLGVTPGTRVTITLPNLMHMMDGQTNGQNVLDLWTQQTGLSLDEGLSFNPAPPAIDRRVIAASYFEQFDEGRNFSSTKKFDQYDMEKLIEGLPIRPSDELWLWATFFEEAFPGVTFIDCGRDGPESVWTKLLQFLPPYVNHPFYFTLFGLATTALKSVRQQHTRRVSGAASVLRRPASTRSVKIARSTFHKTVIDIGPQLGADLFRRDEPTPTREGDVEPATRPPGLLKTRNQRERQVRSSQATPRTAAAVSAPTFLAPASVPLSTAASLAPASNVGSMPPSNAASLAPVTTAAPVASHSLPPATSTSIASAVPRNLQELNAVRWAQGAFQSVMPEEYLGRPYSWSGLTAYEIDQIWPYEDEEEDEEDDEGEEVLDPSMVAGGSDVVTPHARIEQRSVSPERPYVSRRRYDYAYEPDNWERAQQEQMQAQQSQAVAQQQAARQARRQQSAARGSSQQAQVQRNVQPQAQHQMGQQQSAASGSVPQAQPQRTAQSQAQHQMGQQQFGVLGSHARTQLQQMAGSAPHQVQPQPQPHSASLGSSPQVPPRSGGAATSTQGAPSARPARSAHPPSSYRAPASHYNSPLRRTTASGRLALDSPLRAGMQTQTGTGAYGAAAHGAAAYGAGPGQSARTGSTRPREEETGDDRSSKRRKTDQDEQ